MIINDKETEARLNSPINLINKLKNSVRKNNAMSLFIKPSEEKKEFNPFQPQSHTEVLTVTEKQPEPQSERLDDISSDHDSKIKLGLAHDKALELLTNSVSALAAKLDDVKADKLPSVIAAASKTVESIRRERLERDKNNKDKEVHYHFYTPTQRKLEEFAVIEVSQ